MSDENQHVCMMPKQPACLSYMPTAGRCKHIVCRVRRLSLPARWHVGTTTFFRSQKSLAIEQERQAAGPWYIWHPYSTIKFSFDCFKMVVMFCCMFYTPMQVFVNCPNPADPLLLFFDFVAFLDIISNFITGVPDTTATSVDRRIVLNPKKIAFRYIKDRFFWDLISALPLHTIRPGPPQPYDCVYPTHTAFLILKLLRMQAFCRAWKILVSQIGMSYVASVATTVLFRMILYVHWLTYFMYQVASLCKHFHGHSDNPRLHSCLERWLRRLEANPDNPASTTLVEKYITNLHRVFTYCIGTSSYDAKEERLIEELVMVSIISMAGCFFLGHSYTALLRLVMYWRYESLLYEGRHKELKEYLDFKRLPPGMQQKIQLFISYKFNGHYFNEKNIVNTINDQIKQEINMFCCKRLVSNVPLFHDLPIALINTIIFSLTEVLYMPGEVIVKCGKPGKSLYLIASGTVAVMNATGKEVAHLKDGACFGERALLQPGLPRSVTIVALEITEIYKLNSTQFAACLQPCPRLKRRLQEVLQNRNLRRPKLSHATMRPDISIEDISDPPSQTNTSYISR